LEIFSEILRKVTSYHSKATWNQYGHARLKDSHLHELMLLVLIGLLMLGKISAKLIWKFINIFWGEFFHNSSANCRKLTTLLGALAAAVS